LGYRRGWDEGGGVLGSFLKILVESFSCSRETGEHVRA